jgi:hypothetical protein
MRRSSLITVLVFVAGLGIGYFTRSAADMLQLRTHAADLRAIEKAHQRGHSGHTDARPERADGSLGGGCSGLLSGKPACRRQAGHWGSE